MILIIKSCYKFVYVMTSQLSTRTNLQLIYICYLFIYLALIHFVSLLFTVFTLSYRAISSFIFQWFIYLNLFYSISCFAVYLEPSIHILLHVAQGLFFDDHRRYLRMKKGHKNISQFVKEIWTNFINCSSRYTAWRCYLKLFPLWWRDPEL